MASTTVAVPTAAGWAAMAGAGILSTLGLYSVFNQKPTNLIEAADNVIDEAENFPNIVSAAMAIKNAANNFSKISAPQINQSTLITDAAENLKYSQFAQNYINTLNAAFGELVNVNDPDANTAVSYLKTQLSIELNRIKMTIDQAQQILKPYVDKAVHDEAHRQGKLQQSSAQKITAPVAPKSSYEELAAELNRI